jgi:2-succinyl-5-enolpyruvyl-6-hydroxy-3-cyclohexene-1-carboxylate synthase
MRTYRMMFPTRKIFLLSTHDGEAAYEDIPHTQIALDDAFAENPPGLTELERSLVVFDDTDNLEKKKILEACKALNSKLISDSRKYDVHVVTLSHMLMDHHNTRKQLNEAQRVIFFPQGSSHHNKRYLKEYAGFDAGWIRKILAEKSRWICIDFRSPKSYVTENAVVIIR